MSLEKDNRGWGVGGTNNESGWLLNYRIRYIVERKLEEEGNGMWIYSNF